MPKKDRILRPFGIEDVILIGKTYYYRGTPYGTKKQIEKSLGIKEGAKKKDVLAARERFIESKQHVGSVYGKNSFALIAKKYLAHREEEAKDPNHLSASSIYECRNLINNHLIPFFGNTRIEEVTQSQFSDYCKIKFEQNNMALPNHRKVINHFLKWCVQYEILKYRPELQIPKFAKKEKRQRRVLTESEIKNLIAACDGSILLYVSMYLLMGMRNMEICKLRWDEIDLKNAALQVNAKSNRTRKARAIPINPMVLNLLRQEKLNAKNDYVFPSKIKDGKYEHIHHGGGFRKSWMKAVERSGIKGNLTPHDLRATFETHMHINTSFTDSQREKMAGAQIDVQKKNYVSMTVDHLRGLESSVQVKGLDSILEKKIISRENLGKKTPLKKKKRGVSVR